ncbi:MAG: hypothetical protein KatS3mg129_3026 [Leptospiraceae bacterium]|nr:MAG: hypothetical protein KatS3mg129_3026 [Leptospiraceae bacterium]
MTRKELKKLIGEKLMEKNINPDKNGEKEYKEHIADKLKSILIQYIDVIKPKDIKELKSIINILYSYEIYYDDYEENSVKITKRRSHKKVRKVILTEEQKERIREKIKEAIKRINRKKM